MERMKRVFMLSFARVFVNGEQEGLDEPPNMVTLAVDNLRRSTRLYRGLLAIASEPSENARLYTWRGNS